MRFQFCMLLLLFSTSATTLMADSTSADSATYSGASFRNSVGIGFRLCPAGVFMMGSTEGHSDEKPVHEVTIEKPFFMSMHEITQQQWQEVMGNNPATTDCPDCPVTYVSWEDARVFCGKLGEIDGMHYRLPTEEEWEYVCRAGTGGDCSGAAIGYSVNASEVDSAGSEKDSATVLSFYSWSEVNSDGRPREVDSRAANPWDFYDMCGNVWEWCLNTYGPYKSDSDGEEIPDTRSDENLAVARGGSWNDLDSSLRCANRLFSEKSIKSHSIGFRVVSE